MPAGGRSRRRRELEARPRRCGSWAGRDVAGRRGARWPLSWPRRASRGQVAVRLGGRSSSSRCRPFSAASTWTRCAGQHQLPAVDDHGLPARPGRVRGERRPPGRHVRPRQDLQLRLRRLHGRLDPAVIRPVRGWPRGAVADRLAGAAGRRRIHAHGELGRDPDRCLPGRPARFRAGHEPDRRPGGHVRRARGGRPAGGHRLARGVLGQRARRHLRDGLGVPAAPRQRRAASRPHRLVGQYHLRRRAERGPDRRHLRHPALRRAHDGLDESVGARRAGRRRRPADRVRVRRDQDPRADVPAQPVPHPGLHGRQPRGPGGVDRPGRPAVHAHHLAAGHLAAAARLRLQRHPAVGGHLPAAPHRRVPRPRDRSRGSCPTGSVPAASPPPGWRSSAAASSA